jgi:hypothetical protein
LTTAQLEELALKLEPLIREKAKENLVKSGEKYGLGKRCPNSDNPIKPSNTISEVSKAANMSCDTQWKTKKIQARGARRLNWVNREVMRMGSMLFG